MYPPTLLIYLVCDYKNTWFVMIFFVDYLVVCHIDIITAITQRYNTRLDDFMWTFFVVEDIIQRLTTASLNNSSTVEKKGISY